MAWSYPVFFKCEEGGRLSHQLTPVELSSQLKNLLKSNRFGDLDSFCQGNEECLKNFSQLMELGDLAKSTAQVMIDEEIKKIRERAKQTATELQTIVPISETQFKTVADYTRYIESFAVARECSTASHEINKDSVVTPGGKCVLANFNHSPYMYVAGVRENGVEGGQEGSKRRIGAAECSDIQMLVENAVASDQDPYAALAISLMENGTNVGGLYLDPIGSVQTLGCSYTQASKESHNFSSYSTYYNVQYGVVKNPLLLKRIQDYVKMTKTPVKVGKSYLCDNSKSNLALDGCIASGGSGVICTTPQSQNCCVELPFENSGSLSVVGNVMVTHSLEKYIKAPLQQQYLGRNPADYPARRIQRFNGYSDSMGGGESVSAWRSGVNYYESPAYGFQAMDFIINSLWNNPFVRDAVEQAEKSMNKHSPSVMCLDRAPGIYTIDHNYYFEKHANSPRMTAILNRWKKNPSWSALNARDRNVLKQEFDAVCSSEHKLSLCPDITNQSPMNITESINEYFNKIYPLRQTVALANGMDQKFTWKGMTADQYEAFTNSFQNLWSFPEEKKKLKTSAVQKSSL